MGKDDSPLSPSTLLGKTLLTPSLTQKGTNRILQGRFHQKRIPLTQASTNWHLAALAFSCGLGGSRCSICFVRDFAPTVL